MVTPNDIKWGSWDGWEGPRFGGVIPFKLPPDPSFADKLIAVTSTAEANYDGTNMYDSCVISHGLSQWCERAHGGTSDLIGYAYQTNRPHVEKCLQMVKAGSILNGTKFRFTLQGKSVEDEASMRLLYFGSPSIGRTGTWTAPAIERAKLWCVALASIWTEENCRQAQVTFTKERLEAWYVQAQARRELYDGKEAPDGWVGAMRALYVSYALNSPSPALKAFATGLGNAYAARVKRWSPEYCRIILAEVVFGSKIATWPHRYNVQRPIVEALFGVDLPDMAKELETYRGNGHAVVSVKEAQGMLLDLGFDLGPSRDDGIPGMKTKAATRSFQMDQQKTDPNMKVTGDFDVWTIAALQRAVEALKSV